MDIEEAGDAAVVTVGAVEASEAEADTAVVDAEVTEAAVETLTVTGDQPRLRKAKKSMLQSTP